MPKQASGSAKDVPGQRELMAFIDEMEQRLEAVETAYRERQWARYVQPEAVSFGDIEKDRTAAMLDEEVWLTVVRWVGALSPANPAQRRLVLLGRRLIVASVESQPDVYELRNQLEADFLACRPHVGREHLNWGQLTAMLHTEADRYRRQRAWGALLPLAAGLRDGFLELVRRRNYHAQKQGYPTYIDLALAPQGLSRDSVLERYVELEETTVAAYRSFVGRMQHQLDLGHLSPWDMAYLTQARLAPPEGQPSFSGGSEDIVALIEALGLPWDSLHIEPQITDRLPYTSVCWPVHVPDDVRLAFSTQRGWEAYIEIARAYGQALLVGLTRQPSYLLRDDAPCFREGMRAFLARLAAEPTWLRRRRLLPDSRVLRMPQITLDLLVLRLRRLMALNVFEYQVYETPDADLDAVWGRIQEAFLLLPNEPWSGWAAQPDYILRPIHLQDEVIGEIIASQAVSYLYQRFGFLLGNPEVTEFLKQTVYGSGSTDDWIDKVRAATGKFLSNKALFGELVGEE